MTDFQVVDADKAPRLVSRTGAVAKRMAEYDEYVKVPKKNQVGVLTPTDGDTARGIALRISRAGRRAGLNVNTWIVEDKVYFKVG